ncbi:unnamed protein product [Clavelina lepadiformis]|uniref:Copper transport protein n=1 Tax=Clavelina lepadiformis TaxID=159417 RepID=A0ABP0FQ69_CLALP
MDMDMDMDMSEPTGSPGGMGDMGSMTMTMYFNFLVPFTVVFQGWEIKDQPALIGSCFGVLAIAILYEVLKNLRQIWGAKMLRKFAEGKSEKNEQMTSPNRTLAFWTYHTLQSFLHIAQVFLAYFLMLVVMTYNVWLVVSACVGAGLGYFISGGVLINPLQQTDEKECTNHKMATSSYSEERPGSLNEKPPSYDNKAMSAL